MTTSRLITLLACAVALAGCEANPAAQTNDPTPRPVLSVIVSPQPVAGETFSGTIEPRLSSVLGFMVPGRILSRDVSVGDHVTRGQRLAAVDPLPFGLTVTSARAELANASAQKNAAESSEQRLSALYQQKIISSAQFESVQQGREAAVAAATRAGALLDMANDQLSKAELRADFDGVVTAAMVEPGQTVAAGQPVVIVAAPDVREAVIDVPDGVAATLHEGSAFRIATQTEPDEIIIGTVREIAPHIDTLTMSRRIKIALDNPLPTMRLGTTVVARLDGASTTAIQIPDSALLQDGGKAEVWIVDPATLTVSQRVVTVGKQENGVATITAGLEAGARVVTAGVHSLVAGQTVKIDNEAS